MEASLEPFSTPPRLTSRPALGRRRARPGALPHNSKETHDETAGGPMDIQRSLSRLLRKSPFLSAIVFVAMGSILYSGERQFKTTIAASHHRLRRLLSTITPIIADPVPQSSQGPACTIPKAEAKQVDATVVASYPGSGAKLSWKTIRALTGIMTGDDHDHNGLVKKNQVVSIKTHYPALDEDLLSTIAYIPRAVLLLRNPLNAIPSLHNFEYEQLNNLPNHSTRAPLTHWLSWRDNRYSSELQNWRSHLLYWVNRYPPSARTIITFERMTSPQVGVDEFQKLGEGLAKRDPRITIPQEEELPCLWDAVVSDRLEEGQSARRQSRRRGRESGPSPYTQEQLEETEYMFRELKNMFADREVEMVEIMDEYLAMLDEIRTALMKGPSVEERMVQEDQAQKEQILKDGKLREEQKDMPGWEEMKLAEQMREARLVTAKRARKEKLEREGQQPQQ